MGMRLVDGVRIAAVAVDAAEFYGVFGVHVRNMLVALNAAMTLRCGLLFGLLLKFVGAQRSVSGILGHLRESQRLNECN